MKFHSIISSTIGSTPLVRLNRTNKIPDVKIVQKVEANMVFAYIPKKYLQKLRESFFFHVFDENAYIARLMCSFNTKKESIDELVDCLRSLIYK